MSKRLILNGKYGIFENYASPSCIFKILIPYTPENLTRVCEELGVCESGINQRRDQTYIQYSTLDGRFSNISMITNPNPTISDGVVMDIDKFLEVYCK